MLRSSCTALAVLAAVISPAVRAADLPLDTAAIESITGITGTMNKGENVFKVSKPRTDIKPNVDRWTLPPFMGITSYAAFTPMRQRSVGRYVASSSNPLLTALPVLALLPMPPTVTAC